MNRSKGSSQEPADEGLIGAVVTESRGVGLTTGNPTRGQENKISSETKNEPLTPSVGGGGDCGWVGGVFRKGRRGSKVVVREDQGGWTDQTGRGRETDHEGEDGRKFTVGDLKVEVGGGRSKKDV